MENEGATMLPGVATTRRACSPAGYSLPGSDPWEQAR